jgi:TRAP-type C4-dicarboxylate transport system permease small subunit
MDSIRVKLLGKIVLHLRETVEVYLPMLAFSIMFVVFILQIFFRYVLRQPLQWAYEVTVSCYLWLVLLGACYAQRERKHVSFNMLTNKLSSRRRAAVMFLGNLLMLVAFAYAFFPSVDFIIFMNRQRTSVFKVGLDLVYFAYIPFMLIMMVYFIRDMIPQGKIVLGLASEEEILDFDRISRDDFEEANGEYDDVLDRIKEGAK